MFSWDRHVCQLKSLGEINLLMEKARHIADQVGNIYKDKKENGNVLGNLQARQDNIFKQIKISIEKCEKIE